jgi:hypothetical protein
MGASPASGGGPGYPLVSFLPPAKKDTAPIPCAEDQEKTAAGLIILKKHSLKFYRKVESNLWFAVKKVFTPTPFCSFLLRLFRLRGEFFLQSLLLQGEF